MAKYCPQKRNYALYLDCKECDDRLCEAFFCLVVGSRSFDNYDLLASKLDTILFNQDRVVIVSGGARGADSLAEQYAKERGYAFRVFPADLDLFEKAFWDDDPNKSGGEKLVYHEPWVGSYVFIRGFDNYSETLDGVPYTMCDGDTFYDYPIEFDTFEEFKEALARNFVDFCKDLKRRIECGDALLLGKVVSEEGYTDDIDAILNGANGVWA